MLDKAFYILVTPGNKLKEDTWSSALSFLDPLAMIAVMGLLILTMMGAKRAGRWIYWTVGIYILIKLIQGGLV